MQARLVTIYFNKPYVTIDMVHDGIFRILSSIFYREPGNSGKIQTSFQKRISR